MTFVSGDKVMQIENDYEKEVYNGDIGTIDDVNSNSGELIASFDGRTVTYGFGELDTLVPAYAATIHKSQGSEYPAVIIPVLTHFAAAEPALYRRHTRQEAGRIGRTEEGGRHRGPQRVGAEAVVEAQRVAAAKTACLTTVRHGELSQGRRGLFCRTPRPGSGSMASNRPGRSLPSDDLRAVQWRRNDRLLRARTRQPR